MFAFSQKIGKIGYIQLLSGPRDFRCIWSIMTYMIHWYLIFLFSLHWLTESVLHFFVGSIAIWFVLIIDTQ